MPQYAEMLAQQLGSAGTGGIVDLALQPWRNQQQQKQNAELIRQQIEGQKEMGLFNVERQIDLWNRTNAGAQMEHYKKAGLNPALMYEGSGSGGATAAAQTGNVSTATAGTANGGTEMNVLMPAQVELMKAQARNLDADTAKKSGVETEIGFGTLEKLKAETNNIKVQTTIGKIQAQIAEISQEDITDAISLQAQKIQQEVFQIQNQTDISNATKQTVIQTVQQNYVNAVIQAAVMKSNIKVNNAQINKMSQDILQGWEGLDIKAKEQRVEQLFKSETIDINSRNASTNERAQQADETYKEEQITQQQVKNVIDGINTITDLLPSKRIIKGTKFNRTEINTK